MAHYDVFRHHLAIRYPAYGYALWEPRSAYSYPTVKIGDVGFIRQGRFHRLFNALLPAEDPSHENFGVPEQHEQLELSIREHITPGILSPNNLYSTGVTLETALREWATDPDSPAEVEFSCGRKQGAVLSLPIQARSENTVALGVFGKWMIKHIDCWFAWVRRLGLGIDRMEDIVLVTGTDLTRSWTNVAFPGGQEGARVSYRVNVATRGGTVAINWIFSQERNRGAVLNCGPDGEDLPEDQCIFVRGFRVARKLMVLPRELKAAAGPNPDLKDDDCEPDMEFIPISAVPEYRDPLHILLEYIAEEAPNCEMALVHDDDLTRIDGLSDVTLLEDLQPDSVLHHLRYLKPKVHDVLLGTVPSSGSSSANTDARTSRVAMLSTIFEGRSPSPTLFAPHQSLDHISESPHVGGYHRPHPYRSSSEVPSSSTQPIVYPPMHTSSPSNSSQRSFGSGGLPPLPQIGDRRLLTQIFTHRSLARRPKRSFEDSPDDLIPDNEQLVHIGDPVFSLVVTDLIRDLFPHLSVGPSSRVRDRLKSTITLARVAVSYRLHERLLVQTAQATEVKASPNAQAEVFKAYIGGLYREQGMGPVNEWLRSLFELFVQDAYENIRHEGLMSSAQPTPPPPLPYVG